MVDFDIWPTESAITAMTEAEVSWPRVVEAVRNCLAVVPSDRADVSQYLAEDLTVLVTPDHHVIGVKKRDPGEALPDQKTGPAKKIVRKGKRGGIGNVGPRDHASLLKAIAAAPGWSLELDGAGHYKVLGPNGEITSIPQTPSDHRSTQNQVSKLKRVGLDLRELATA